MKKLFLSIFGVALFIAFVGLLTKTNRGEKTLFTTILSTKKVVKIKDQEIVVKVARTEEERRKGLSGVENLPENEGMLFILPKKDIKTPFWMKGMKIAIDIIWINDDRIVQIDEMVSPPPKDVSDSELPLYVSGSPIDYVLEVNSGYARKYGFTVGDAVDLSQAL